MKTIAVLILLAAALVTSGCVSQGAAPSGSTDTDDVTQQAIQACIQVCMDARDAGADLEDGPCLSDSEPDMPEGWVCDVAHSPRQAVDNQPANQCPSFGKTASHFVEVYPSCEFLRSY